VGCKVGETYCLPSFVKRSDRQRLLCITRSRWEYKVKRKFKVMDECGLGQSLGLSSSGSKSKCVEFRD
jgi:hypothetical protein